MVSRAVGLVLSLLVLILGYGAPVAAQEGEQRAGLVVVHGDGRVVTRCVAFSEPQISGSALLERSGLAMVTSIGPLGQTICSLNGEGCPSTACFCACTGTPCEYWIYYHRQADGAWSYANIGAAQRTLSDGDVDAWVWGEAGQSPPAVSFASICAAPEPVAPAATPEPAVPTVAPTLTQISPTATPAATATSAATATLTASPDPTRTPVPAVTAEATVSPTSAATATPMPSRTSTPAASPTPTGAPPTSEAAAEDDAVSGGGRTELVAFGIVLGIVALTFFLSRRTGA